MKRRKDYNYLDLVPTIRTDLNWKEKDSGAVVIIRENRGITFRIAHRLYGTPRETKITLDEYGNFIWHLIDGKNSVYAIALKVKDKYGEKVEPLFERICKYFKILEDNKFVVMS